jgi:hypothetical protein
MRATYARGEFLGNLSRPGNFQLRGVIRLRGSLPEGVCTLQPHRQLVLHRPDAELMGRLSDPTISHGASHPAPIQFKRQARAV